MNKENLIIELLVSLNQGNSGYINDRVKYAIEQYNQLVENNIIIENQNKDTGGKKDKC